MATRRQFISRLAGLGASVLLPRGLSSRQAPGANPRRLDFHHHFGSPALIQMMKDRQSQGWQTWQPYTPARAIEDMDKGGVVTSFISITTPGIWFGNTDETRRIARRENEYGARMVSDHRSRFALFAVLPLPDVDGSLREIEYTFDTLKAEGVGLLS